MKALEYPFNSEYILKKSKRLKRELLEESMPRLKKKIAVLGGSTTHDIVRMLELFLLNQGIEPEFYESEYGQYFQEAMFENEELSSFAPDIIFFHTSNRNIAAYPQIEDSKEQVEELLEEQYGHFSCMWDKLRDTYHCPIIQNNFEYPFYRMLGNKDASDIHGRIRFITRLNERFYDYAQNHENFYINDINYMAAAYGLDRWSDPFYWHMYKYCMCMQAIPEFAFNLSNIIKAVFGKNKKALVLDLDNTLWGGVVGDDGAENLEIGQETSLGQVYSEFQGYIKAQKEIGVMLNVSSKNEEENALAGLSHPEGILKPEDFILIKANWEPKSINIDAIASELNILPDSLVFVDDNPAEREIVSVDVPGVAVPDIGRPEQYIHILDRSGFFEVTGLSQDDRKRNEMYKANLLREKQQAGFADYAQYLLSLSMHAVIKAFEPMYMSRIAQLTNKSNQFNLTTKRYTQSEIEQTAASADHIALYGRLEDKFGDNGIVSVVIGRKESRALHIELWIMSCRVLKRDMEYAMMDCLVQECKKEDLHTILGYYYPTAKNQMVKNFYDLQGFSKIEEDSEGNTTWEYKIPENYENKNKVIEVV
ncbi:HAD superfamily phosphatase (TIGR01681 family)/FkbH-like protein [Kineothrix alysoides]|uniref:HAD superfamily phosphatase (TIGR01681 family)/FkbH-like protein n=1 Tax=Kineothrix alysoides TaxID=1469948 RepID=A0A4V2QC89_9FIRM|nr:HAD-IIIC family phosphatase [Kineothrix alysoides]TCL59327.1 HAD superfamily phosphatase (TIGR01681 family)/FkbH-like protein [Kineothrix alysoides]